MDVTKKFYFLFCLPYENLKELGSILQLGNIKV